MDHRTRALTHSHGSYASEMPGVRAANIILAALHLNFAELDMTKGLMSPQIERLDAS